MNADMLEYWPKPTPEELKEKLRQQRIEKAQKSQQLQIESAASVLQYADEIIAGLNAELLKGKPTPQEIEANETSVYDVILTRIGDTKADIFGLDAKGNFVNLIASGNQDNSHELTLIRQELQQHGLDFSKQDLMLRNHQGTPNLLVGLDFKNANNPPNLIIDPTHMTDEQRTQFGKAFVSILGEEKADAFLPWLQDNTLPQKFNKAVEDKYPASLAGKLSLIKDLEKEIGSHELIDSFRENLLFHNEIDPHISGPSLRSSLFFYNANYFLKVFSEQNQPFTIDDWKTSISTPQRDSRSNRGYHRTFITLALEVARLDMPVWNSEDGLARGFNASSIQPSYLAQILDPDIYKHNHYLMDALVKLVPNDMKEHFELDNLNNVAQSTLKPNATYENPNINDLNI